jgi:hypothetical protein
MKKLNLVLSAVVFSLAIAAAFASNSFNALAVDPRIQNGGTSGSSCLSVDSDCETGTANDCTDSSTGTTKPVYNFVSNSCTTRLSFPD